MLIWDCFALAVSAIVLGRAAAEIIDAVRR